MTHARFLALNALSMLLAQVISKIVLLIGVIFLLQYLNQSLESTYYLATALGAVLALNFQDGMVSVSIRRIATDMTNGEKHLGDLFVASFFLALIIGIITIPISFMYARSALETSGLQGEFILSSCYLVGAYLVGYGYSCAGAGFKAYEKLYLEAILVIIQAIMNALVYWYGAGQQWPLSRFFQGLFVMNTLHAILSILVLIVFVAKPKLSFSIKESWNVFHESLGLGYATLLRTLQDRIHPFFIDRFVGHDFITQFSSSNQLAIQFKFIPLSVKPAIFPTFARKAEQDNRDFQLYSLALMKFLYLIAIPLMIVIAVGRNEILPFFTERNPEAFQKHYTLAMQVLPLACWAVALSFPSQVLRSLFVALKKPIFEFRTVFAGVLVLAIIDLILVPMKNPFIGGVMGAAISSVVCEITIISYGVWLLAKVGRGIELKALFVSATLCGIFTHLLAEWILFVAGSGFAIISIFFVFPLLVFLLRVVSREEWSIVKEIIKPGSRPV